MLLANSFSCSDAQSLFSRQKLGVAVALPPQPRENKCSKLRLCLSKLGLGYNESQQPSSMKRIGIALCVKQGTSVIIQTQNVCTGMK